ncbi:MAG: hypothetical protein R2699_14895 [Acidimicrobiales bacterium]
MPVANAAFDAYREAYLRRDATTVLRDGDDSGGDALAEAPWSRFLVPAVIVLQDRPWACAPISCRAPGEAIVPYLAQGSRRRRGPLIGEPSTPPPLSGPRLGG